MILPVGLVPSRRARQARSESKVSWARCSPLRARSPLPGLRMGRLDEHFPPAALVSKWGFSGSGGQLDLPESEGHADECCGLGDLTGEGQTDRREYMKEGCCSQLLPGPPPGASGDSMLLSPT